MHWWFYRFEAGERLSSKNSQDTRKMAKDCWCKRGIFCWLICFGCFWIKIEFYEKRHRILHLIISNRGYMNGLFLVQHVTEKRMIKEEEMYMIWRIYLKKAYNSIFRNGIWWTLQKYHFNIYHIGILKAYMREGLI